MAAALEAERAVTPTHIGLQQTDYQILSPPSTG